VARDAEENVRFVEIPPFPVHWKQLGFDDDHLLDLQRLLWASPQQGAVVPGTGGLRKLRFVARGTTKGKSGGCRVYYAVFPEYELILLLAAYSKSQREDLTRADRAALKAAVNRIADLLKQRARARDGGHD
jgi:hypothetical protein